MGEALAQANDVAGAEARRAADEHSAREKAMTLLVRLLRYHLLRGRRDQPGARLTCDDKARLRQLEQLFTAEPEAICGGGPGANFLGRLDARRPLSLAMEFRGADGKDHDGALENVSRGGVFVATDHPGLPGEQVSLRFVDEIGASEWQVAVEVAWVRRTPSPGMGVRFVGIPVQIHIGSVSQSLSPVSASVAQPAAQPAAPSAADNDAARPKLIRL